jgi:hypothetical protein
MVTVGQIKEEHGKESKKEKGCMKLNEKGIADDRGPCM